MPPSGVGAAPETQTRDCVMLRHLMTSTSSYQRRPRRGDFACVFQEIDSARQFTLSASYRTRLGTLSSFVGISVGSLACWRIAWIWPVVSMERLSSALRFEFSYTDKAIRYASSSQFRQLTIVFPNVSCSLPI